MCHCEEIFAYFRCFGMRSNRDPGMELGPQTVLLKEIPLISRAHNVIWIDELRLLAVLPKSYSVVHIESGLIQDVFWLSGSIAPSYVRRNATPVACLIADKGLLVAKDCEKFVTGSNQW